MRNDLLNERQFFPGADTDKRFTLDGTDTGLEIDGMYKTGSTKRGQACIIALFSFNPNAKGNKKTEQPFQAARLR